MLIGFAGKARSGKSTAAQVFQDEFGFKVTAFADPLREVLLRADPIVFGGVRVSHVIERYGWEEYKSTPYYPEIRGLMKRLGTDAVRSVLGENTWVDATIRNLPPGKVIVSDVRFPNEAEAVQQAHGVVVRIENPNVPQDDHDSETALDGFKYDFKIHNTGTLEQFKQRVREFHDYVFEEMYFRRLGM